MMMLIHSAQALRYGIALSNLFATLGSSANSGQLMDGDLVRFIFVPAEAVLWVPNGWYTVPLYYHPLAKGKPCDEWIHLAHVPRCQVGQGVVLARPILEATHKVLYDHMCPNLTQKQNMWKERREAWDQLYEKLKAAAPDDV